MSYFEIKQARKPESPSPGCRSKSWWIVHTEWQTFFCENEPHFMEDWVYFIGVSGRKYYFPVAQIKMIRQANPKEELKIEEALNEKENTKQAEQHS